MSDRDSSLRIEIAIRAALMAKACLELVNMEPAFVRLQLEDIARQAREIDAKVRDAKVAR